MARWRSRRRASLRRFLALLLVGLTVAIAACSGNSIGLQTSARSADKPARVELTLVSFAVTRAAYKEIIPLFAEKWQQEHNQEVIINTSFGGSGSQTRAVIDGLDADVVGLALALDTKKIEKMGLIQPGWEKRAPNQAIVTRSVIALVTRAGNPKNIQSWQDLARNDVKVITANPKTSGGARWNFLGLWGAIDQAGGTTQQALDYTTAVFKNVPVLPRDAREATDVFFKQNQGDVLINYENEVLLARQRGIALPYIVPDPNISIDNPIAIVDANVDKHKTREVAEAFVQFLYTPAAQRAFAKVGFRPVNPTVAQEFATQYPAVNHLFSIADLGGWKSLQAQFFDDGAAFDKIQAQVGRS